MASKLADLAKQLEQAQAEEEAARLRTDAALAAWRAGAAEKRTELLDEIDELAASLDVVDTTRDGDRLELSWRGHTLAFYAHEDGDRLVVDHALSSSDELIRLTPKGVWRLEEGGESAPLFTAGLEDLLVRGLGLPRPGGARPGDTAPRPVARRADTATVTSEKGRGPNDGEPAKLGRAGTRGFKRASKVQPGAIVKEFKGPLD